MTLRYIAHYSFFPLLAFFALLSVRHGEGGFNWQTVESGMLKIHWYQGDADFGQAALAAAQMSLESIGRFFPSRLEQQVEIFIYANRDDLQSEFVSGGESWIAGHADPALGIIRVVVEPGTEQDIVMEQRIPHELMHVMLYRRVGPGYNNLPAWLREGTATLAETYPNADFDRALTDAASRDRLIPLKDLCVAFPGDTGEAFLAYAESRSFTNYLHDTYGSTGLLDIAMSYADGVDCERGTIRVSRISLSNLELQWRSDVLGENAFLSTLQKASPYLALLCLVLIIPLIGIVGTLRNKRNQNGRGTYVRKG